MTSESSGLSVIPVRTRRQLKKFIRMPWAIYKDDAAWVPPLLREEKKRMNRKKNPFFDHAEAEYFIALRDGEVVGRITAQIDRLHNEKHQEKTGFFGFFESVQDPSVSHALLDCATDWLRHRGMDKVRGPVSFTINEVAGLLVDGHQHPPLIMTGHNPAHYQQLLEEWGLVKAKDMYCWSYDRSIPIPPEVEKMADEIRKYPGLTVRAVDKKQLDRDIKIIFDVFNSAWEANWGFVPLTERELNKIVHDIKRILDTRMAMIAEVDGKPVAIILGLPDINSAIKDLNGRLFPFGFAKLLYRIKKKKIKTGRLLMMGIKKEYRGSALGGLSILMYTDYHKQGIRLGYTHGELSWTLEDNTRINLAIEMMGGKKYKTYRIYEKQL